MSHAVAKRELMNALDDLDVDEDEIAELKDRVDALDLAWRQEVNERKKGIEQALMAPQLGPDRKSWDELEVQINEMGADAEVGKAVRFIVKAVSLGS